jgi:hypothetical protein
MRFGGQHSPWSQDARLVEKHAKAYAAGSVPFAGVCYFCGSGCHISTGCGPMDTHFPQGMVHADGTRGRGFTKSVSVSRRKERRRCAASASRKKATRATRVTSTTPGDPDNPNNLNDNNNPNNPNDPNNPDNPNNPSNTTNPANPRCCAAKFLSNQPDFLEQTCAIQEVVDEYNKTHNTKHTVLFLPKFHPEVHACTCARSLNGSH